MTKTNQEVIDIITQKGHPQPIVVSCSLRARVDVSKDGKYSLYIESVEELARIETLLRERLGRVITVDDVAAYVLSEQLQ